MEPGVRRMSIDLPSRILSIVSLCVALAAMAFLYVQNRGSGTREQLLSAFSSQLGAQAKEYSDARQELNEDYQTALDRQDARMEAWNKQLNDALHSFRTDAETLLAQIEEKEQTASEARQLAFRQTMQSMESQMAAATTPAESQLRGPRNGEDAADTPPTLASDPPPTDQLASLDVVNTVLRPGTGNTTLVVIRNNGQQDALINRIRFRPQVDFKTTDDFELSAAETPSTVTTFTFAPADNRSSKPGYHGIYDRPLENELRVPAGETLTLRVLIDDTTYEGWGFAGKLVVEYNADQPLEVESARVAFLGRS